MDVRARQTGRPRARRLVAVAVALACASTALAQSARTPFEVYQRAFAIGITGPLFGVAVPEPKNLDFYVKDRQALLVLGKALFWDQQAGSDGNACASCHFHAGADSRSKNQLTPGLKNESAVFPVGDLLFGNSPFPGVPTPAHFRANYQLTPEDFPLHKLANPADRTSAVLSDTNDVVASQGVFNAALQDIGLPYDFGIPAVWVFNDGGVMVRNVEPRNTPSVINAVFNSRNFWDGRARGTFNGQNPFGELDPAATVVMFDPATQAQPTFAAIAIEMASLASQAVGPPLSDLEMAFQGLTFARLGRKLLRDDTVVLANQRVSPTDSVLGPYSLRGNGATPGTTLRYRALVEEAFWPKWWDAPGWRVRVVNGQAELVQSNLLDSAHFTVMEYNFPLFFGLAIAAYEATLVSDQTRFDFFMAGDMGALTPQELAGLDIFVDPFRGRCAACHGGAELTTAAVRLVAENPVARMVMGDGRVGAYDEGFYNIGVRPSDEDRSLGAQVLGVDLSIAERVNACISARVAEGQSVEDANVNCGAPRIIARPQDASLLLRQGANLVGGPPEVFPLLDQADAMLLQPEPIDLVAASAPLFQAYDLLRPYVTTVIGLDVIINGVPLLLPDPTVEILPDPPPPIPEPPPPGTRFAPYAPLLSLLAPNERTVARGAFKVPSLRNVEFTAPYFHNGGQATLEQVVEFYNRGGDFGHLNPQDLDIDIQPLGLSAQDRANLVAFLKALTDERVRWERAPFDHPSLSIPNGGTPGKLSYAYFPGVGVLDDRIELPEVGAEGAPVPLGTPNTPWANFLQPLAPLPPTPATGVVVTPSVTNPAEVGTAVTFTAQGIGGTGTYEYQFYFKTMPDGAYSIVQPYSTNASWTMPTDTPAGDYRVLVYVRTNPNVFKDAQGGANFTLREGKVTGVAVVASAPSPQPAGTPVTFTAQAQGGGGTVQYRFYWKELSAPAYTMVQDYSEQNTWTIPADTVPGSYRVLVYARAGTSGPQGAQAGMNYTVSPAKATGVTLAASAPSPQPASAGVTFTAQGEGGSGTYQYRFYWKEQTAPSYTIVQDYGAQNTWTIPANTPPGNYRVMAYVRTATSGAQDAMVGMNYTVRPDPATGLTVTATPSGPQPQGVPITFNAAATGGSGTYQYKFHFKPLSAAAYTVVQDWSTDSSWQSASDLAPGDYRVLVYVRTGTTGSYDVMAGRNFTVTAQPLASQ